MRFTRLDLAALALLALLALAFFWPVTLGLGWIPSGGGDLASFLWPTYSYAAQSLRELRLPLWNPSLYAGAPFAADNQSGLFYPIHWLAFLLAPGFPYLAVEALVILHVWLAGAGMYLLLRDLLAEPGVSDHGGAASAAALFAGVAYMFSDVFVTHIGNLNIIAVSAWLPLALLALRRARVRASSGWAAAAGGLLGTAALAGHAQMTLITAGALGLYGLWEAGRLVADGGLRSRAARAQLFAWLGQVALVFGVALGVSALAVVPAAEMTAFTGRARLEYAAAADYSLPWQGLAGLFSPLIFGRGAADFWGPWDRVEAGYLGLAPLFFAGLAPFRRRGLTLFLVLLALFGLLAALGENTPVHRLLYLSVPGFAQLRVPARFILLTDFSLAVLAGLGLQRVCAAVDGLGRGRGLTWGIGLGAGAAGLCLWGYASAIARTGSPRPAALLLGLAVAGGLLVLSLGLFGLRRWRGMPWLAVAVLAADLLGQGAWVEVDRNDPTLGFQNFRAAAYLQSQSGPVRIDSAAAAWAPDAAARFGLEDIGGVSNPLALAAYQTYRDSLSARGAPLYNFLNAKFVIADKDRPPADATFIPVFNEDPRVDVYLNTHAMPRVSLVYQAQRAADGEAAFALIQAPGFDPAQQVVIEASDAPLPPNRPARAGTNLYYLDYAPEAFSLIAHTPVPAYLVFSEVWYPGWTAWVNGEPTRLYRANFAFRAIYLPSAGEYTVRLAFEPPSWRIGLAVTGLTLAGLTAAALRAAGRRPRLST